MSLKVNPIVQPEGADFDSSRPPMLALECVGYDEEGRGQIERFIEVYHAAHSATSPPCPCPCFPQLRYLPRAALVTPGSLVQFYALCVSNGGESDAAQQDAQRGEFLEQHFAPSVPLPSSPGHLIMFHTTRRFSFLRFPF